jgi:hypothetical protein
MKTYKVLKGYYNSKIEIKIKLPEKIKLIYKEGEIGTSCYIGHNHYIGFIKKSDCDSDIITKLKDNSSEIEIYDFLDLIIIVIKNISPIDTLPVYSSEEIMKEFKLDEYYVLYSYPDSPSIPFEDFLKKAEELKYDKEELNHYINSGKCYCVYKIKSIEGPYNINVFRILIEEELNIYSMELCTNIIYYDIFIDFLNKKHITYTKNPKIFNSMCTKVLNKINEKL